jgi:hypothetical protein
MLSYKVFKSYGGALVADWSVQVQGLTIETTPRGYGTCTATIPMRRRTARHWYATLDNAHLVISENGLTRYEGRIEITETTSEGLALTAYGYSRAYSDIAMSDMWSTMSVAEWITVTLDMAGGRNADMYEMDTDNRVAIGLQKGSTYRTGLTDGGTMQYEMPLLAQSGLQSFSGTYNVLLPVNWKFQIVAYSAGYTSGLLLLDLVATGVLQTAAFNYTTLAGRPIVLINVFNNTGGNVTYAGENGTNYAKLTGIRATISDFSTLTSDEIVRKMVSRTVAANPLQASSVTARIKSPGIDIKEYAYDQVYACDVLDYLAALAGDGYLWSWRVWDKQILIFDRIVSTAQTFQIRTTPDISRDMGSLRTGVAPIYTDAQNKQVVGTPILSATAEARYGIRRTMYYTAPTSSSADATTLATAVLVDASVINAWGDITVTELWQNGQRVPLTALRSGDIVQCIEFPSTGNSETDKTRQFTVTVTGYDHDSRALTISPEQRQPTIDSLLARRDVSLVGR